MSEIYKKNNSSSKTNLGMYEVEVKVYRGMDGLEKLKNDWKNITNELEDTKFYHQYEWYYAYLAHLEPEVDRVYFFLVVDQKNRKPLVIIPLKRQLLKLYRVQLKVWVPPRTSEMCLYDFVATSKESVLIGFNAVFVKLKLDKDFRCDAILLSHILEGGNIWDVVHDESIFYKTTYIDNHSKYLVCVEGEGGIKPFGTSKFRRNLRRLERRLKEIGNVSYHSISRKNEIHQAYEEFLLVEGSGWKGLKGTKTAIKLRENVKKFYLEVIRSFGKLDKCVINLLKINEDVIAAQFCIYDSHRINLLKIGYDENYKDYAPSFLLIKKVFEEGCKSKSFNELSFVTGSEWIDVFKPLKLNVISVYISNITIKGLLVFVIRKSRRLLRTAFVKIFQKNY